MNDAEKLQAWWAHRQGLDGSLLGKTAAEVLESTGWARTVGGAGAYVGLFARAGLSRETVDGAVAALDVHELPSARGCTYLLPAADYAIGLKAAQAFSGAEMKTAQKLGVTETEVDKLCGAVVAALEQGPLDPDDLKKATGGAARSLGPAGAKKGLSNTLPLALERLQVSGEIRRIPVNGRLDQQRYKYALWKPNPLAKVRFTAEVVNTELARRYFRWTGPATLAEFRWFTGLGVKSAAAAIDPLELSVDETTGRILFAADREAFLNFRVPEEPHYVLVSSTDAVILLRRALSTLLAERDRALPLISGVSDLPSHAILDRGRIVGLWEYDPATSTIAWASFIQPDKALKEAVANMEAYVRDQLGDARSFSLDSPKSRVPRIEALRAGGGAGL